MGRHASHSDRSTKWQLRRRSRRNLHKKHNPPPIPIDIIAMGTLSLIPTTHTYAKKAPLTCALLGARLLLDKTDSSNFRIFRALSNSYGAPDRPAQCAAIPPPSLVYTADRATERAILISLLLFLPDKRHYSGQMISPAIRPPPPCPPSPPPQ